MVTPRYLNGTDADKRFAELEFTGVTKKIEIKAGDIQTVSFYHKRMGGADIVFVDHPAFHRHGGLYGVNGRDYDDNLWRFALLRCTPGSATPVLPSLCTRPSQFLHDSSRLR